MKRPKKRASTHEDNLKLRPRPRASETVSLQVPLDALASLEKVAASRDMSSQALMKFYIGQGLRQDLRQDLAKLYADRVMDRTAEVLARHLQSQDEVSAIIREIREEAVS